MLGRFLTEDPARDGGNWFAYVGNNPLRYIDPTGLFGLDDINVGLNWFGNNFIPGYEGLHNAVDSAFAGDLKGVGLGITKAGLDIGSGLMAGKAGAVLASKAVAAVGKKAEGAIAKEVQKTIGDTVQTAQKADFYVNPSGDTIPSKGYRYISKDVGYLGELEKTMTIPKNPEGTYFSFDKFDTPSPNKLQVPHDASIRGDFDTLQIVGDVSIPKGKWGTADYLEPITKDFPKFGSGGATQATTTKSIKLDKLNDLNK